MDLFDELEILPELFLHRASLDFAPPLFQLLQTEYEHLKTFLDWPEQIQGLSQCERLIREMMLFNVGGQKFFCFITHKGQLAGSIALSRIDYKNKKAELGFWKSKIHLSKEHMLLATERFIELVLDQSVIHRLEIRTLSTNAAARRLAQKLAFQKEATLRDAIYTNGVFWDLEIWAKLKE